MAGLTEDELKALTDSEMRNAVGYFGGKLANMRQKNLWYYEGVAKGDLSPPEIEGRSSVVATEVRNVVESILPELMAKFASSERVVELEPAKEGDEQASEIATDYLNYLFYKKNDGHRILLTMFKDALISKIGVVKVWWDDRAEETKEEYRGLDDVELAQLMDDDEIEVTAHTAYPDEEDQEQRNQALQQMAQQAEQAAQAAQSGNPQAAQALQQMQAQMVQIQQTPPKLLHDVTCKRTKKGGKIAIENVPPEELLISRKAKNIKDSPFVGHRVMRTASELKSQGYKNVDAITSDDNGQQWSMERVERVSFDDEMPYQNTDAPSVDPSQRLIWVTECYIRADYDGDGISELRKVVRAGNQILENVEVDVIPFVHVTPIPLPHRLFGLCPADLAIEPQRVKTSILRAMLDNLYLSVNGRYFAVEGQVNLDDLLTSRPGGVVRVKQPGAAGRLDQGYADSTDAMGMLQYMEDFTEKATGWNRMSQANPSADSMNQTATAANIVTNKADMRNELIARNLAEGIVELFRLMLKLICQHQDYVEDVKLNGKWVSIDPREWRNQFNFNINIGLGTGNKDQQIAHLNMQLQHQGMGMQIGIATPENIYQSAVKLSEALGFRNAQSFWTDPAQIPQQPKPDPEMMKIQAQVQMKQQELQAQDQFNERQAQREMQLEQWKQSMQSAHTQRQNELEAQRASMQQHYDALLESQRQQFDAHLASVQQQVDVLITRLNNAAKVEVAEIAAATTLNAQQISSANNATEDDHGNP